MIESLKNTVVKVENEQAINTAGESGAECDATFAGALIDAGWRPTHE